jgi:hypothetical protein
MPKTKIKRKELSPVVLQATEPVPYTEARGHSGAMDDAVISKLVKDINKLGQKDHEIIYKFLRKHKQANFFAVNGLGTCFNIFMVPDAVRWELFSLVQMSLQNMARERQISAANEEHSSRMELLDSSLTVPSEHSSDYSSGTVQARDERTMQILGFAAYN